MTDLCSEQQIDQIQHPEIHDWPKPTLSAKHNLFYSIRRLENIPWEIRSEERIVVVYGTLCPLPSYPPTYLSQQRRYGIHRHPQVSIIAVLPMEMWNSGVQKSNQRRGKIEITIIKKACLLCLEEKYTIMESIKAIDNQRKRDGINRKMNRKLKVIKLFFYSYL